MSEPTNLSLSSSEQEASRYELQQSLISYKRRLEAAEAELAAIKARPESVEAWAIMEDDILRLETIGGRLIRGIDTGQQHSMPRVRVTVLPD